MSNKPDRRSPERLALTLILRVVILVIMARFGYVSVDYLLEFLVDPSAGTVHGRRVILDTRPDEYSGSLASGRGTKWRL